MNRFLKVFSLVAFIAVFASCQKDDTPSSPPPRDFGVQNVADTDSIVKFLKTHTVVLDETTLAATFPVLAEGQTSIWDDPRRDSITVRRNSIDYKIYYLNFRQGVGKAPSGVDDVTVNYRGTLLDGTQFDYRPVAGNSMSLYTAISGWQDIIPLFQGGTYVEGGNGSPASFIDFGAGAMFLPSGLAYFNGSPSNLVPAYSCLVFSFQLMDVKYTDIDGDKILNKDEFEWQKKKDANGNVVVDGNGQPIWIPVAVVFSDTDGDGIPNYADVDDDGDGRLTKDEIRKLVRSENDPNMWVPSPTLYWTYAEMFDENGNIRLNVQDDPDTEWLEEDFGCGDKSTRSEGYTNVPKYMDGCKGGAKEQ